MAQTSLIPSGQGTGLVPGMNYGNPAGMIPTPNDLSQMFSGSSLEGADPFSKKSSTPGFWTPQGTYQAPYSFLDNPLNLGPNITQAGVGNIPYSGAGSTSVFGSNLPGISIPSGLNVVPGYDPSQLVGGNTASSYNNAFGKQLSDIYGTGVGSQIYSFLKGGAGYNPAVATALINQMMPLEARGSARILESFGATGNRYSSSAAIGLGDFESQFAANAQGILAQEYENSVNRYAQMLTNLFDPAQSQQANQPNTMDIISSIIGTVGSIVGMIP